MSRDEFALLETSPLDEDTLLDTSSLLSTTLLTDLHPLLSSLDETALGSLVQSTLLETTFLIPDNERISSAEDHSLDLLISLPEPLKDLALPLDASTRSSPLPRDATLDTRKSWLPSLTTSISEFNGQDCSLLARILPRWRTFSRSLPRSCLSTRTSSLRTATSRLHGS